MNHYFQPLAVSFAVLLSLGANAQSVKFKNQVPEEKPKAEAPVVRPKVVEAPAVPKVKATAPTEAAPAAKPIVKLKEQSPAEIIKAADAGIALALSSHFEKPTLKEFNVLVADRVKTCSKAHKECLDTSKWAKTSCQTGFEPQLDQFFNLWNSIATEAKTEAEAKLVWANVAGCSAKQTLVQTAISTLLVKVFYLKRYNHVIDGQAWPWLKANFKTRPEPAEFAIPFMTQVIADAENMKPTPYSLLGEIASGAVRWPPLPASANLPPAVISAWVMSMSRIVNLVGRTSLIPDFVEKYQASIGPADMVTGSEVISIFCSAARGMGQFPRCEQFIQKRFPGMIHGAIEIERAEAKFEAGDVTGARALVDAAATGAGKTKSSESALNIELAKLASFEGKAAEALKALAAAAYPDQLLAEKLKMGTVQVGVQRRAGQIDAAAKTLADLRQTVKQNAAGSYTPAMELEYEAMLLAMQKKDLAGAKAAARAMKERMTDDPTQKYYAAAVGAVEKKQPKSPGTAELALAEKVRGANYPLYKEFAALFKNI